MKDFLCQIKILLLNIFKMLKTQGFLFKIPGFLFLNCQIPGFSRYPGKDTHCIYLIKE